MAIRKSEIEIPLQDLKEGLKLFIYGDKEGSVFEIDEEEANENGESKHQILEGNFYSYYFKLNEEANHNYQIKKDANGIVTNARRKDVSEGRIAPNIYVGTLSLDIISSEEKDNKIAEIKRTVYVEVLATKMDSELDKSYRENYRYMLKDITDKCTELLLQINSPINQNFETDFNKDNKTIYQRFAFIQSLIQSNEFNESVQKIISSPTTKWKEELELKDIRSVRRINNSAIRQIASRSNRIKLSNPIGILIDIPSKIETTHKVETVDTPENRFIKYALEVFLKFCTDCYDIFKINKYEKSSKEAYNLIEQLENHLNHPFFLDIERPTTLKLNSPALQRKSGYREVLNAWLQYDLAAKLIWKGGDDVYKAGKRDIAVLYEYWLFFVLYDLIKDKFKLNKLSHENKSYEHLIDTTKDELNVMVKSGKYTALEGEYDTGKRKLNIKFSYNRTFNGDTKYQEHKEGSWTKVLRPDYTLSIWPNGIDDNEAEKEEKIVHIHFDSKYKVKQFTIDKTVNTIKNENGEETDTIEEEKREERKGNFKNVDLLKMHAYKDAIRRTGGAYILYPGTGEPRTDFKGFHELIPGLGAFAITPKESNNGSEELGNFIDQVIKHFENMASQQRRLSSKIYEIHDLDSKNEVNEALPEYIIPDETFVLIGYYKDQKQLNWITKTNSPKMYYNVRYGEKYNLSVKDISAKYLLLYTGKEKESTLFYKLKSDGPKFYSKEELVKLNYPTEPTQPMYMIYEIEQNLEVEFQDKKWDLTRLPKLGEDKRPYSVSLSELMKTIEK